MDNTSGSVIGGGTTLCAIFTQIIPVQTAIQTAVCAAIGAFVGFVVTYALKKVTAWIEKN